ncbi:MAG: BrnT family toxin [Bryobacteraceae bacterium]
MADREAELDWDEANIRHLRRHRITPLEFQQVLNNGPFELDYQTEDGEDRYKSVGLTDGGRLLVIVWTNRNFRIRAVTAYAASSALRRVFEELLKGN